MVLKLNNTKDGEMHIKRKFAFIPKVFMVGSEKYLVALDKYYQVYKYIHGNKFIISEAPSLEIAKNTLSAYKIYEKVEVSYEA